MSADLLRRAAALMRERAERATSAPWDACAIKPVEGDIYDAVMADEYEVCITPRAPQGYDDQEHIASWHPAVARAVADWLDAEANVPEPSDGWIAVQALAVARAYLGEQP